MKTIRTADFIKKIQSLGYTEGKNHNNGGHRIFVAKNRPPLAIPNHRELSPGTRRNIEKLIPDFA